MTIKSGNKHLRPFVGILFTINKCEYFAPLSSPKEKHKKLKNTIDLIKIKNGEYGVVNFNNMIPVTKQNYIEFNLKQIPNTKKEKSRLNLLRNQLRWLTSHKKDIYIKSKLLYELYRKNKLPINVKERCCNYVLLETKCKEFNEN